jgi:hypothetical protein
MPLCRLSSLLLTAYAALYYTLAICSPPARFFALPLFSALMAKSIIQQVGTIVPRKRICNNGDVIFFGLITFSQVSFQITFVSPACKNSF